MFRLIMSMLAVSVVIGACDSESRIDRENTNTLGNTSGNNAAEIQVYNLGITDETVKQIEQDKTTLSPQTPVLNIQNHTEEQRLKFKGNIFIKDSWQENPKQSIEGAEVGVELKFDQ